jgi:hypothetical protein
MRGVGNQFEDDCDDCDDCDDDGDVPEPRIRLAQVLGPVMGCACGRFRRSACPSAAAVDERSDAAQAPPASAPARGALSLALAAADAARRSGRAPGTTGASDADRVRCAAAGVPLLW